MDQKLACVPSSTSLKKEDSNKNVSSMETLITGTWDRADVVLQSLKDTQSELLNRVQKLKEEWQFDVDLQLKACDQEIEALSHLHNVEIEKIRTTLRGVSEHVSTFEVMHQDLQNRANAMKDQLSTFQQNWQQEVAAITNPVTTIASVPRSKRNPSSAAHQKH